jgi:hypothetical protein
MIGEEGDEAETEVEVDMDLEAVRGENDKKD